MSDYTGYRLGTYTLVERLGMSSTATVYRSHHPLFDRPVAVKVFDEALSHDSAVRERFTHTRRTLLSLSHPGLVRIYAMDEDLGLFYIVSDLLPGGSLEQKLHDSHALDRRWSCDIVARVADALDYAHALGVVHRDVRPANILFDAHGAPLLSDIELSFLLRADSAPGPAPATLAYLAPEQLRGERPDARADIYALGVILYQLLIGHVPFRGSLSAIVDGHLAVAPPSLRDEAPGLPSDLDNLVARALAKEPYQRPASAASFALVLRRAAPELEPIAVPVISAGAHLADRTEPVAVPAEPTASAPTYPNPVSYRSSDVMPLVLAAFVALLLLGWVLRGSIGVMGLVLLIGAGGLAFYLRSRTWPSPGAVAPADPAGAAPPVMPLPTPPMSAPGALRPAASLEPLPDPGGVAPPNGSKSPSQPESASARSANQFARRAAPLLEKHAPPLSSDLAQAAQEAQSRAKPAAGAETEDEDKDEDEEQAQAEESEQAEAEEDLAAREVNGDGGELALALGESVPQVVAPPRREPPPPPPAESEDEDPAPPAEDDEETPADEREATSDA